jgi:peptidoglycan biosynthesis protein MviN/MurJ (putative lipid II flippase)
LALLVGGLLQFAIQLPSLWVVSISPDSVKDPGIADFVLMVPSVIAARCRSMMVNSSSHHSSEKRRFPAEFAFRLMQL